MIFQKSISFKFSGPHDIFIVNYLKGVQAKSQNFTVTWHISGFSLVPRGGLGIFTDRDQRSIFWVLNLENLYFLGTARSCCIFWIIR